MQPFVYLKLNLIWGQALLGEDKMSISRRQFNRIVIWGGASFAASATSGIFFPKPAEAYSLEFPISALSADRVFNGIQKYCGAQPIPGVLSPIVQGNSNVSSKNLEELKSFQNLK